MAMLMSNQSTEGDKMVYIIKVRFNDFGAYIQRRKTRQGSKNKLEKGII